MAAMSFPCNCILLIQGYATYQAAQFFYIKQAKGVTNTHKHLP